MKRIFVAIALTLAFGTANATCGLLGCGSTTTNNYDNSVTNQGGQGGAGGAGGAGGNASVIGSGNSSNINANTNVNSNTNSVKTYNDIRNTNMQGQAQGQKQGQAQGQLQGQGQSQSNSAVGSGNSTNVTVESTKQAVSGPGIASNSSATCRIAVGLSVGGTFGGVGGFGSVEDANCVRNEKIRMLKEVLSRPDAAKALACKDEAMAEALGDCGTAKTAAVEPTVVGGTTRTSYDPFSTAPQQR